ncbi:hypothetical protein [Actinoplanes derwentensis]|uniref:Uncharacterized protein n=1 Tax=Actinoplanes derwentensis TaxID=113562 RepID=A0A1H1YLN6_9ACTN|nr:hypothetical protein [Actinoplanes derwentensis]GID81196.1 hypothetical protein Ade03nite_01200 [Actinoplanes derwentensis]SDT22265.1 hypothetical protein SAMN04489716_2905 [Actinoplanes derwentensis]
MWARWEADTAARKQWRRTRTDDVLVARPGRLLANPRREARDTTHLLRMLLQHDDNRSVRLLRHLGVCIPHGFGSAEHTPDR